MAAHAKLGPSAAHRWFACPGSIRASVGKPNNAGIFAAEGTAAHAFAAYCLQNGHDPDRYLNGLASDADVHTATERQKFDLEPDPEAGVFEINDEMVDAVDTYLETCRGYMGKAWEHEVEQRLDLTAVHKDIFGTGDFLSYNAFNNALVVADFKYGKGVPVEVKDNEQLLTYGLGAAMRYHNRGIKELILIVVQPRCPHPDGPVRIEKYDALDLAEFRARLSNAAKATEADDAPLIAGDHCKFCPAASTCPAYREKATALAEAEFSAPVVSLDSVKLGKILAHAGLLKDWIKRVEEHAQSEAQHGRLPTGFKLVAKRATRKWKDAEAAEAYLTKVLDLDADQVMTEPKLRSPAQIEAVIGKKNKGQIEDLVEAISSGTNLVPLEDPRPTKKPDAETEFS